MECRKCKHLGKVCSYSNNVKIDEEKKDHPCLRIKHSSSEGWSKEDLATVADYEQYSATLLVKKSFGCIYFEEK